MILRLLGSGVMAVLVSLLLFTFMVKLLSTDTVQQSIDQAVTSMQFVQLPPEPAEPPADNEQSAPPETQVTDDSRLLPVAALPQVAAVPAPDSVPLPRVNDMAVAAPAPTSNWGLPPAGDAFDAGEKGKGYIEVVPLATRRPNIPERAWRNKIDGWVLVAFTLKPDGRTTNVRVLDAHPGGVFEDNVVRAVEDWLYDMSGIKHKGNLILTQKIELFWQDFPDNSPYLD